MEKPSVFDNCYSIICDFEFLEGEPMMEENAMSSITIQKVKGQGLVIEIPVVSLSAPLRSGRVIAEAIKTLCDNTERQCLEEKLERFLKRAHKAEEKKNNFRAARAFVLALYCEGKLRSDVKYPCSYVRQALPVY